MSKILTVADIHIHAYPTRNPSNDYRLFQGSRIVADNIIKAGKTAGCDYIVFAGDIIEKSIIRPYIQAEVKQFLEHIMSNFKEGWIIWGNHDQDNKSTDSSINDSCLGIMLPTNLHYAHQKMLQLENSLIGFSNWLPEFDLSWIPNKVDVLFTHARICYNTDKDAGILFESQELDESKFDLAICGDIHKPAALGKYVSIGIPQRCKMGDSDVSTGVVYDCVTKQYDWIDLNPDNNLMRFEYTPILEKEGWNAEEGIWYVYKQENAVFGGPTAKVSSWESITALIDEAICKSNLQSVHKEVLKQIKDIDANEVDFDFTLLHLHCENWRSIETADIDLANGDKIYISGANGSGKSSLLSAIRYALVDVSDTVGLSSLKPFVQFGKTDCLTEVTFLYQGNICKIQRGTKQYGLWINDEPQKYSEKRLFEKDVRERFPFIKYLDSFFFDTNHNSFIADLSPERLTEITSKFLKLDRLDTYNDTARLLSEQFRKEEQFWNSKINETTKLLNYIEEKLATITVPSITKAELEQRKLEGLEIQRKNTAWNSFVNSSAQLHAQIQQLTDKLNELNIEKLKFRDPSVIDAEIGQMKEEQKTLQTRMIELGNIRTNLNFKQKELDRLRTEGNNAYKEAQSIAVGKKCSLCGQIIKNTEAMENHKNDLLKKVEELRPQIDELKAEISELERLRDNSDEELMAINTKNSKLNSDIASRMAEKTRQSQVVSEITRTETALSSAQQTLNSLGVVERVDLPENFMAIMSDIESGIIAWNIYETNISDRELRIKELEKNKKELARVSNCLGDLDAYIKLTGPVGLIQEEIMNKLKDEFSDNLVKYTITRKGKGNREHLSFSPQYFNGENYVEYMAASSGQRTLLDLHFLSKIVTRLGLLILDEYLKCLDPQNTDLAIDLINSLNVGCIFISSHLESIAVFNNKTCRMSLDDHGHTVIDFK